MSVDENKNIHEIRFWTKKLDFLEKSKYFKTLVTFAAFFLKIHTNSKVCTFRKNKDTKILKISSERSWCVLSRQVNEIYPPLIFWLLASLNAEIFKKLPKMLLKFIFPRLKLSTASGNAVRFICDARVESTGSQLSLKIKINTFD